MDKASSNHQRSSGRRYKLVQSSSEIKNSSRNARSESHVTTSGLSLSKYMIESRKGVREILN